MIGPRPAALCTPHRDGMLLIDAMLGAEQDKARSETIIKRDNIFFEPGRGVPGYIGFELMAQTINAFDGWRRIERGQKPTIGFLLGCRRYACRLDYFAEGARLVTEVRSLLKNAEDEMVSFECRIFEADGVETAHAVLKAYRPHAPDAFLKAQLAK